MREKNLQVMFNFLSCDRKLGGITTPICFSETLAKLPLQRLKFHFISPFFCRLIFHFKYFTESEGKLLFQYLCR